jgi:hypothetical protein
VRYLPFALLAECSRAWACGYCLPVVTRLPIRTTRRSAMTRFDTKHFLLKQLEDGWMLETSKVTKDVEGDWMLSHDELEELHSLLQKVLR